MVMLMSRWSKWWERIWKRGGFTKDGGFGCVVATWLL